MVVVAEQLDTQAQVSEGSSDSQLCRQVSRYPCPIAMRPPTLAMFIPPGHNKGTMLDVCARNGATHYQQGKDDRLTLESEALSPV